jgi:lipooligosaccharide transport system ATP-binding protein
MSSLLDARGLVKHLGGRRVVDGVDLQCEAGQIVGLLGPNGGGKTTTLSMLYGFLRPDAGRIHVEGVELGRDLVRAKRAIGVCTQDDTVDGDFSVEQNLTIAASYFRPVRPIWRGGCPSCSTASSSRRTREPSRRRSPAATGAA